MMWACSLLQVMAGTGPSAAQCILQTIRLRPDALVEFCTWRVLSSVLTPLQ